MKLKFWVFCLIFCFIGHNTFAKSSKFRCMWRDNPATSMVIGWDQESGSSPLVFFDTKDHGNEVSKYRFQKKTDSVVSFHEMNNNFARFNNLLPNTVYYFIIKDNEGQSERYSFKTAPADPNERLSIVAGGDSRNQREACRKANLMVSKLHPNFVLFGGDMTESDNAFQWKQWLDDWQLTISPEGRMTPIIVARGNHEYTNNTLVQLFDVAATGLYYKFDFGGNLLSVYTLNSLISAGGDQKDWLQTQMAGDQDKTWRMAQYHFPMRPHTKVKVDRNDQAIYWATLFSRYSLNVAVESDAHVAKITYPIKPFAGLGADQGFIRDDETGTVYLGEGGWGAPLRQNNDNKNWTMESGSFNHFNWLWVDQNAIQVRTVKTDNANNVANLNLNNVFAIPQGIDLWKMGADVVYTINRKAPNSENVLLASRSPEADQSHNLNLKADPTGKIRFGYSLDQHSDVEFAVYSTANKTEVLKSALPSQAPGKYERNLEISALPPGKYMLIIRANKKLIQKYNLFKN